MTKNNLLRYSVFLFLLTALNSLSFASDKSGRFYEFTIGKINATVLTDGHVIHAPIQPNNSPEVPVSEVMEVLLDNYASITEVDMSANILLLQAEGRNILVDAGNGDSFGEGCGWLIENLKQINVLTSEITDIVLTHAHCDHVGGMTDKNGTILFPNANVYISQPEYDFWMSANPDFSRCKFTDENITKALVNIAQKNIDKYTSRIHVFNDGDILFGFMEMILAPGHTPGHSIIRIFSQDEEIYHIADLAHSPILQFYNPEWGVEADTDFDLAAVTRRKFMQKFTEKRVQIIAYHLPYPGLGNIRKLENGFEWIQKRFAVPY